jgi:signal recognition particle GTPase
MVFSEGKNGLGESENNEKKRKWLVKRMKRYFPMKHFWVSNVDIKKQQSRKIACHIFHLSFPISPWAKMRRMSVSEEQYRFLERTRKLFHRIENALQPHEILSDTLWEDLKENLLAADISPATSLWLIQRLQQRVKEEEIHSGSQVSRILRQELIHLLGYPSPLRFSQQSPVTVMVVMGENGSGKTTSLAKLAYRLTHEGHTVLIAAADTSRSNDIDPLKAWDEQMNVPVIGCVANNLGERRWA